MTSDIVTTMELTTGAQDIRKALREMIRAVKGPRGEYRAALDLLDAAMAYDATHEAGKQDALFDAVRELGTTWRIKT